MRATIPRAKYQSVRASKQMYHKIIGIKKKLNDEVNLQIDILYHASAIALYRFHGWNSDEIVQFFKEAEGVGEDCSKDYDLSAIELCWEELDIELTAEGVNKRWFEVAFLDSTKDIDRMRLDQFAYYKFFENQIPWVPAQVTASILIALHRAAGWKAKACGEFIKELEQIKYEYEKNPNSLRKQCMEECEVMLQDGFWVFDKDKTNE